MGLYHPNPSAIEVFNEENGRPACRLKTIGGKRRIERLEYAYENKRDENGNGVLRGLLAEYGAVD